MFEKILDKRQVLIFSTVVTAMIVLIFWLSPSLICGDNRGCGDGLYNTLLIFLPVIPVLFWTLIIYKLEPKIYKIWIRFTVFYLAFSTAVIALMPSDYSNFIAYDKQTIAVPLSILFFLISFCVILITSIRVYRKKK